MLILVYKKPFCQGMIWWGSCVCSRSLKLKKKDFKPSLNPKIELTRKWTGPPKGRCDWSRDAESANLRPMTAWTYVTHLLCALSVNFVWKTPFSRFCAERLLNYFVSEISFKNFNQFWRRIFEELMGGCIGKDTSHSDAEANRRARDQLVDLYNHSLYLVISYEP